MKTFIYFQSDKLPNQYGVMINIGKVYDTQENVEKVFHEQKIRFLKPQVAVNGNLLYTIIGGK